MSVARGRALRYGDTTGDQRVRGGPSGGVAGVPRGPVAQRRAAGGAEGRPRTDRLLAARAALGVVGHGSLRFFLADLAALGRGAGGTITAGRCGRAGLHCTGRRFRRCACRALAGRTGRAAGGPGSLRAARPSASRERGENRARCRPQKPSVPVISFSEPSTIVPVLPHLVLARLAGAEDRGIGPVGQQRGGPAGGRERLGEHDGGLAPGGAGVHAGAHVRRQADHFVPAAADALGRVAVAEAGLPAPGLEQRDQQQRQRQDPDRDERDADGREEGTPEQPGVVLLLVRVQRIR